jgi:hypothetical protein
MNRLKFLVFALIALGLWAYHLLQVSPAVNEPGQAAARNAVVGAPAGVALALESQRSELQAAVLKLAASPAVLNVGPKPGAKVEAPGVDRFAAVRPVVADALSEANKAKVVVGLVNEAGALVGQGTAEPAAPPEDFDVQALAAPGATPAIATFNGAPTLFYATPLLFSDKNEVRAAGTVLVGLPLLPDAKVLEELVKAEGLKGLALLQDGKVLVAAGDQASAAGAVQKVKAGTVGVVSSGSVRALGPLDLPLLVGSAALDVAARQPVAGTPFEVIAIATARSSVDALASYQVFAVSGLLGLLLLTVVFALLIQGGGEEEGARMVVPPPMPVPPLATKREEPPAPAPLALSDHAPASEASPDDFDFPMSGPSAIVTGQARAYQPPPAAEPGPQPEADPFAAMAPPPPAPAYPSAQPPSQPPAPVAPPPPPAPAAPPPPVAKPAPPVSPFEEEDEGARTVAYPAFKPPTAAAPPPVSDPFALAASQLPDDGAASYEDSSDATRVAAVPQELIRQARSGAAGGTSERPSLRPPTTSLPRVQPVAPVVSASEEDRHFQDVFRDFVATRQKCGEPADGLTFEKFKAKLLKNKEQLVAKYQCRTVRFQVYVKDGKAALKATPVKD